MVLVSGAEYTWVETTFDQSSKKILSVHPAKTGYPTLFRAREGLGSKEKGEHQTLLGCSLPPPPHQNRFNLSPVDEDIETFS